MIRLPFINRKKDEKKQKEQTQTEDEEKWNSIEVNLQGGAFVDFSTNLSKKEVRELIEDNEIIEVNSPNGYSYDFYTDKVTRIYFHGRYKGEKDEVKVIK